ncbi:MAG: alpha/beta fold hydrolase [Brumimicrobium sp.]
MKLNYKKYGEGKPFIILHGLFGSSDNWHSHAKKLGQYFEVYAIDQRNHGDSGWSDEFNYEVMAEDLEEFVQEHNLSDFILLGHSLGGKTAMRYAQLYPDRIEKLISVDMGVKENEPSHDEIIAGLESIDIEKITSRREADEQLAKYVASRTVRQFLLKSLYRDKQKSFAWKINIPVLARRYTEILKGLPKEEVMIDTLFINGEKSGYLIEDDKNEIRSIFPLASFHTVEGAGHWVHAEKPEEFIEEVLKFSLL